MWSWVLWKRIGPFLLTNADCRHCSFHCISSICWAYFSDTVASLGFRSVMDHISSRPLTVTMISFWCGFGFGSALKLLLSLATNLVINGCHNKTHFYSQVTIWLRNGSLLLHRISKDGTSKITCFWFAVSSLGTHLPSFFTFLTSFKCQRSVEWSMLSSWANSHEVLHKRIILMLL